jgi:flavin reductase (DIM6/NTAB) family NADH-FMN oxidoreductase RutF
MKRQEPALPFDQRELRNALGRFATGVAIVTTEVEGERLGATISSFNSVSLDPPLILFSLARASRALPQWKRASTYAVCVLADHQDALSNRFARTTADKWAGLADQRAANGCPLPPDWLAYFACEPYAVHDGGDHDIFVCRVTAFDVRAIAERPLIFYAGKYRSLRPEEAHLTPPDDNMWLHGW